MTSTNDPRWVEHARERGLHLEKVKEGLYIVKKGDASPEHRDQDGKRPVPDAQADDRDAVVQAEDG